MRYKPSSESKHIFYLCSPHHKHYSRISGPFWNYYFSSEWCIWTVCQPMRYHFQRQQQNLGFSCGTWKTCSILLRCRMVVDLIWKSMGEFLMQFSSFFGKNGFICSGSNQLTFFEYTQLQANIFHNVIKERCIRSVQYEVVIVGWKICAKLILWMNGIDGIRLHFQIALF